LAKQSVTADLIFTAGPDAAPADGVAFTLPAAPVTGAVRIETSIPTTGERLVPDTPAGGPVVFSNPTDQEITVPRGTALSSDAGVDYAVTEDLSVPAAANDTPGYATGAVTATQPGTAGNLEIGDLSGRLELGVYFSNREAPIEGGTDRAVQVVSAADLEALRSNAEADITEQAVETLGAGLTPGAAVIAESINLEGLAFEFDRDEGDEATRVGVVATANATGLSYDAQQARADATDALEIELAATAPDGYELAPSTVQLEEPVPLDVTADGARFQVTANAAAVVILPNRDEIAGELAGKDHDAATALVRELPGVERAEITYQPGWWPQRMPRLSRQIDVATHP
jgi:hypothetical protein